MNRVIEQAVSKISQLDSNVDRSRFLRALRYSVQGKDEGKAVPYDPETISRLTGIPLHAQFEFGLILDRHRAEALLESLGLPVKPESFRKRLSARNVKFRLGRQSYRVGNSSVFTYLEILRMEGLTFSFDLPEKIP